SAARKGAVGRGFREGDPGPGAASRSGVVRRRPGRGDRGGGGAGGGVPRHRIALGGRAVARVHGGRRVARSRAERRAVEPSQGAGGVGESHPAAEGAGRGVRRRRGGRGGPATAAGRGARAEARRMIEINLLPGGKRKAAPGAGFKLRLALPDFRALLANVKDPWLIAAVVTWVIAGGGSAALFVTERARLAVVESRLDSVRSEKRRFDVVIAQKRQSEKIRDSLVAEINIIRGIDSDRYIWPHILDQVTKALPPYTWLDRISAQGVGVGGQPAQANLPPGTADTTGAPTVRVWITGRTVDIQAYT